MELCSPEKKALIEKVGLHLEQTHSLPPLACRIYAIMILSSNDGFSFDELMRITQASKSTTSTSINLLLQLHFVEFYTKPGDRKRYFRGTGNYLKDVINKYAQAVEKELQIVESVIDFNRKNNPEKFVKNQNIGVVFKDYLIKHKESLAFTLQKMIEFQENNTDQ